MLYTDSGLLRVMTLGILCSYYEVDSHVVGKLHENVDDPSNAFALQHDKHAAFDEFKRCLKATEVCAAINLLDTTHSSLLQEPNKYRIHVYDKSERRVRPLKDFVT